MHTEGIPSMLPERIFDTAQNKHVFAICLRSGLWKVSDLVKQFTSVFLGSAETLSEAMTLLGPRVCPKRLPCKVCFKFCVSSFSNQQEVRHREATQPDSGHTVPVG